MTTTESLIDKLKMRLFIKKNYPKAHKPDDNIERHEPDRFLGAFQDFAFGMVITALLMLAAYAFMTGYVEGWIAHFIAAQDNSFTYPERLAAFTAAVIALVNLIIITGIAITRTPDNEEVVDAIGDQSDELNERFAELENRIDDKLDRLFNEIENLTPGDHNEMPDEVLKERIGI